jgi:hypothetical protein
MFDFGVLDGDADPCVPSWGIRSYLMKWDVQEVVKCASVFGACKRQY